MDCAHKEIRAQMGDVALKPGKCSTDESLMNATKEFHRLYQSRLPAFTLVELLVVISILGILAALLLPVLSKAKERAYQTTCSDNLRQLGVAFNLYCSEFSEQFPAPGSKDTYGPQPEDWIWWQNDRGVQNSSIARFVGNFNPKLFTCPIDGRAQKYQDQGYLDDEPYRYSYSFTSYDLTNNLNLGMSTIITQTREVYPFKTTAIRSPSAKIMLVEESDATINDPRWVPTGAKPSLISTRHRGRGDVTFADGHVEAETPQFGLDTANSNPSF